MVRIALQVVYIKNTLQFLQTIMIFFKGKEKKEPLDGKGRKLVKGNRESEFGQDSPKVA